LKYYSTFIFLFLFKKNQNIDYKIPMDRNANGFTVVQFTYTIEYSQYKNYTYARNVSNNQM